MKRIPKNKDIQQIYPVFFWKRCDSCGKEFRREYGYKYSYQYYVGYLSVECYVGYLCAECYVKNNSVTKFVKNQIDTRSQPIKGGSVKIFLGGTCNGSNWRQTIISYLDKTKINYFDPVVSDWNKEAQEREIQERKNCDICLYCITPKMTGIYSIAEVVDDSNKRPNKTVLIVLDKDEDKEFNQHQLKSLDMVGQMVMQNGGRYFQSIEHFITYITNLAEIL